jgi:hypothetical protein
MPTLHLSQVESFRAETFQLRPGSQLTNPDQAVDFVNRRGFVYFWPIKDILLPSLWAAVAGDRPVPNNHDDPGHVTWGWKDNLLGKRRWFYAKVLRKKATIISLDTLPNFYALSENYGSPEEDHLVLYEQGRLSAEAKAIYEAILDEGPLDAVALRRAARMTSKESDNRFNRALTELQADFKIMPVGVAEAGAWRYAFIYEIVARHHPEVLEQARFLSDMGARRQLVKQYFQSLGAASSSMLGRLLGWRMPLTQEVIAALVAQSFLVADVRIPEIAGDFFALRELVSSH